MLKVLFFAQLRDVLKQSQIELQADFANVAELRVHLRAKGEFWHEYLSATRALVAVNQTISNDETSLQDGDEVAFFPPVTGG